MDRRQKKSREAIFKAFTELLSERNVGRITVGQIIERADVGRATFYAHFETKDALLQELCQELFCHVFDAVDGSHVHHHIFECEAPESVFEHLFSHLLNNDNQLLRLLSGENRDAFLPYFTAQLKGLIRQQADQFPKPEGVPEDFWFSHISAGFIQALVWWQTHGRTHTPAQITEFFIRSVRL